MIELKNVSKIYKMGDDGVYALNRANLHIEKGEFVSIIGPSGSGKSTMMNIIGCLDVADEGEYILDGISAHERKKRITEALTQVELLSRKNHKPTELSGGQQQRVAIARALVTKPTLFLADEPTGNLDSATGREIMKLFHKLHEEGNTIVLITHDQEIAKEAERKIFIRDGSEVEGI